MDFRSETDKFLSGGCHQCVCCLPAPLNHPLRSCPIHFAYLPTRFESVVVVTFIQTYVAVRLNGSASQCIIAYISKFERFFVFACVNLYTLQTYSTLWNSPGRRGTNTKIKLYAVSIPAHYTYFQYIITMREKFYFVVFCSSGTLMPHYATNRKILKLP